MSGLTLQYNTGRIHLVEHAEDLTNCAEQHTHAPLGLNDLAWIDTAIRAMTPDPIAISGMRSLLGQRGLSYDVTRAGNHRIAGDIIHLLACGHLRAVACNMEPPENPVTVVIEAKRFHIGLGIRQMARCDYQRSHRIYGLNDQLGTKTLLERVAGDSEGFKEIRRFAQKHLKDLAPNIPDELLLEKLTSLVASRKLTLVECGVNYFSYEGGIAEEEASTRARRPASEKPAVKDKVKTWIEIKLVDQDGNPVANEKYELKLPDGSVQEGSLDAQGRARVEEIDPGNCTVCFPDIDGREWKPA